MTYKLGAVGFGHWFERLYAGMVKTNQITLEKVVGVSSIEGKAERLRAAGLKPENYYQMDPEAPLPDVFFEGLDIVHISDPNRYHAEQTLQALKKGKITVTEKTWGANREEFYKVLDYIRENKLEKVTYLHLHYIHKLLTLELPGLLRSAVKEHGPVVSLSATFFEQTRDEDMRRSGWLFSMENGGLFMDWIHPFEVLYCGALASSIALKNVTLYSTSPNYDSENATGVHAEIAIEGEFFDTDATGNVRIAKGAEINKKAVRLYFKDGAFLELSYMDTDREAVTGMRGSWVLDDHGRMREGCTRGADTSDFFVNDILTLCSGEKAGLGLEALEKIFDTQWQYQGMQEGKALTNSKDQVVRFFEEGIALH